MSTEHSESAPETIKPRDFKLEGNLLRAESKTEALGKLTQAALDAKEKFYPQHWYCSDLITNYIKDVRKNISDEDFGEAYAAAMENVNKLEAAFDKMLILTDQKSFPLALVEDQGLSRLTSQTPSMSDLIGAGLSNPERVQWVSLYFMMKDSSQKTPEQSASSTLPQERQLMADYFKTVSVPDLVQDYETFSKKL